MVCGAGGGVQGAGPQTHSSEGRTEESGGEDKPRPRASQEATVTLNVDGNSSRGQRASDGG